MAPDVRIADVWHRDGYPADDTITIGAPSDRGQYGQAEEAAFAIVRNRNGRTGRITARKVVASYTLVERSGVRIGSVRENGGARYRVTAITGDRCDVEGAGGSEDLALAAVAAWGTV